MPLIGTQSYTIDFGFLDTNDPKSLYLLDKSTYLSNPQKPLIAITLPGFTGHVEIAYVPNTIITLNSDVIGLTEPSDYNEYADLPDGVYQITMKVCPYDQLFSKKCYLKTTLLQQQYNTILLTIGADCCIDERKLKEDLIDIDILIQSAKAEVNLCNIQKATTKYQIASKKVENLNRQLNCK